MSRASFYLHFPTKEDVLLELLRQTEEQIVAAVDALPQDAAIGEVLAVTRRCGTASPSWTRAARCAT